MLIANRNFFLRALYASASILLIAAIAESCPNESATSVSCPVKASYATTPCSNYSQSECNSKTFEDPNRNLWGKAFDDCAYVNEGGGSLKVCYTSADCDYDEDEEVCRTLTPTDHERATNTDGWCNNPECEGD